MTQNDLNLHQEVHDLEPPMSDAKLRAAARNAAAAMNALAERSASDSSTRASSLPTDLVEAVMQKYGFSREDAEAELIAFGA